MTTNNELRALCKDLLVKIVAEYNSADPCPDYGNLIARALYALVDDFSPPGLLGLDELEEAWNQQADKYNSWDELSMDEIVAFAQRLALACPLKPTATSQRRMNSNIETILKVWIDKRYLLIRPNPEGIKGMELCTEPGEQSEDWFGEVSILFPTPKDLKTLAEALLLAANEMETKESQS